MEYFRVPAVVFASLAAGGADETGVLREGQLSKRRLLLHTVRRSIETSSPTVAEDARLAAGWALLADALKAAPHEVDRLLLHPAVGDWGMHALRRLHGGASPAEVADDAGYLNGIVAAAVLRAGTTGEIPVRVRADGSVPLPGAGLFEGLGQRRWLTVHVENGVARLRDADETTWRPLRDLQSVAEGHRIGVTIDDLDPHRIPEELPIGGRLSDAAATHWQACLDDAWSLLVRRHPDRALSIARDITCLAPLLVTPGEPSVSASSGDSVGGIALTEPLDGQHMAEALVHEHAHNKLWSLLSHFRLVEPSDAVFYAPWRTDPRPAPGLLQGAYAHLNLVAYWEIERWQASGDAARLAHFEFARWRDAVDVVLGSLLESGALTELGVEFVRGMRRALEPLLRAPVPALALELAEDAQRENCIGWRLRNLHTDPDDLRAVASAWREHRPYPAGTVPRARPVPGSRASWTSGRRRLARERLLGNPAATVEHADGLRPADLAYADGKHADAAELYAQAVVRSAAPVDAWTGLALAHHQLGTPVAATLIAHPELIRELHDTLRSDGVPDPHRLAEWVSDGLTAPPVHLG
ncbi:HEXXH motif domain-containing protein [Cryptosporangium arvum]|uniref:HEXXH motif domain-containing protein n=1 Tax=Cryptosporangium arvum TaxID=80871 RepID=UPI0004AEC5AA|nr:HEXXH motif domain-containing protein [Cryptosporangium arvum]